MGYCPYCHTVQPLEGSEEDYPVFRCPTCGCPLESADSSKGLRAIKPPTVLWIDDDRLLLSLASDALERRGVRTRIATGGMEGIAAAQEERPDLILLDVMMPQMTGLEVCKRLRAEPALDGTPIILLTALESAGLGDAARKLGASAAMRKPFDLAQLVSTIEHVLGQPARTPSL